MRNKKVQVILLMCLFIPFFTFINNSSLTSGSTGNFVEDFTTTTYRDVSQTSVDGWGEGNLTLPNKNPTLVGSYQTSSIPWNVYVDGGYAYLATYDNVIIIDIFTMQKISQFATNGQTHDVVVQGQYAFVADGQYGILAADISNLNSPLVTDSCLTSDRAYDLAVFGSFAYVADYGGGIQIIDIKDPSNLVIVGNYKLPGITYGVFVYGSSLFAVNGEGMYILDISNPIQPIYKSNVGTPGMASNVYVNGGYACVAGNWGSAEVINIHDQYNPYIVGSCATTFGESTDVFVEGQYVYIVEVAGNLLVYDIGIPTTPVLIGSYYAPGGHGNGVFIDGNYAYVADDANGLLKIQKADRVQPSMLDFTKTTANCYGVCVTGKYAYVGCSNYLEIYDTSDPQNLVYSGRHSIITRGYDMQIQGDLLYIAAGLGGLEIVDISNPISPVFVGSYSIPNDVRHIDIEGNIAFLAAQEERLIIVNVSNPATPTLISSYTGLTYTKDVDVCGNFAYIAGYSDGATDGLQIVNITDLTTPTLAGSYGGYGDFFDVIVSGNIAYCIEGIEGVHIFDISNSSNPIRISKAEITNEVENFFISGEYAYTLGWYGHLNVVDIRDPYLPVVLTENEFGFSHAEGGDLVLAGDYLYAVFKGNPSFQDAGLAIIEVNRNRIRQYDTPRTAQSLAILTASSDAFIEKALLESSETIETDTTIDHYLSPDNGNHWELVTPGTYHYFVNQGNQLKWRAILSTSSSNCTPIIHSLNITYRTKLLYPVVESPDEGYLTEHYTPVLNWNPITGATSYLVQIDTDSNFITPLYNETLVASFTEFEPTSILAPGVYYWRVAAIDSDNYLGSFSSTRNITILPDINSPLIEQPDNLEYSEGSAGNTISWNVSDSNPYYYNITLFSFVIDQGQWNGEDNISINVDSLLTGTYFFTCNVYDLDGNSNSSTVIVDVIATINEYDVLILLPVIVVISIGSFKFIKRKRRKI
ncbi:MAG: hypothetical protein GPJ51_06750 [Candidatus Heimdallarchaeota archaeon]|nr:hypothetical protein [Candidatus Heimdallarchaeota archaeon]